MRQEVKELNSLIEQISQKTVDRTIGERYLISRMAVIVNEFDPITNSASIIIPTDLSHPTTYKYPNRTGKNKLANTVWENGEIKIYGDKVYLIYQTNNISQGWLEDNSPLSQGSMNYEDLTNKPSINGVQLSGNKTTKDLNIHVPTKVSDLDNDSGYLTESNLKTVNNNSLVGSGDISINKTTIGLGNVDNTSDLNKPISTATQTALDAKQDTLVSSVNIKTVNNQSLLGSGNIEAGAKFVKGTPINLYDTDGTTILSSKNPENLVFYDGESGDEIANNFMFAMLPSIYALTTSFTSPSWQQVKKGGSGFEINNGSIKCNKNGKVRVIVSGMLSRASSSVADMEQRICLNGVYVEGTTISITQAWTGNATSVGILDVREGDLINVLVKTSVTSANYLGASQMICEYIEDYYITRTTNVPDLQAVYPVGSIYMSVNNTNPYELFGFGTWVQIKDVFLLGAGDTYTAGATGGEAEHILTVDEIPSHSHRYGQYKGNAGWSGDSPQPNFMKNTGNDGYSTTDTNGYMATLNSGGGQAHNNMPPYLVVFMWQRVS